MVSFKKILVLLAAGGAGGILAVVFVLPLLARVGFLNSALMLNPIPSVQPVVTKVEKETIIIPESDYFSEAIKKIEPSIVAIQSFSGGQLIRSGSGIVLTQDGLIATVNSVAPPQAEIFQVFNGGKIYKAKVIFRDYGKNIAIISVPEADFQVTRFKTDLPNLGQELLVFSKLVSFGRESPFVEEAMTSSVDERGSTFEISTPYNYRLYGSALMNGEGTVLGMIYFRNQKPVVIFSKLIEDTLNGYLTRLTAPKP